MGKCPNCGNWNTLVEQQKVDSKGRVMGGKMEMTPLEKIPIKKGKNRIATASGEFNRVLGGGFVAGEAALLTGEPGVGKSTLLLQALQSLKTLYISGEEAAEQIRDRAERLGIDLTKITFSNTVQIESIMEGVQEHKDQFEIIVVDSIQTLYSQKIEGQPGSVSQMRELTYGLVRLAKDTKLPFIIIGHVTKGGDVAGPKTLEHIVDAVLLFEGERISQYRVLRAQKNRFGSTDEIGIFEMKGVGLEEISSSLQFVDDTQAVPGRAVAGILEGKRPLFFEIQTLVSQTSLPMPRRVVKGFDYNKMLLLLAVMRKHLKVPLDSFDIYVNVVGGININSPAADLALIASLLSSLKNQPLSKHAVFVGEVGLLGEVRKIHGEEKILSEAKRLSFTETYSKKNLANVRKLTAAVFRE